MAQRAIKGMSSNAMGLAAYVDFSSSSSQSGVESIYVISTEKCILTLSHIHIPGNSIVFELQFVNKTQWTSSGH